MNGFAVDVDLGNPGQLLACFGLLEAADRLWRDRAFVTGHFDEDRFHVDAPGSVSALFDWLREASVDGVKEKTKPARGANDRAVEYEYAGSGDDAGVLVWPDGSRWRLDSWSGEDFGRTRIKTFAGQMKGPKMLAHLLVEEYDVLILDGANVVRTLRVATQSALYSVGQQTTDFGAPPPSLAWRVAQVSRAHGRGVLAETVSTL